MIAQPVLTTQNAAKPPAAQPQAQPANANGFLTLLSATDPGLSELSQSTGTTSPNGGASSNGSKSSKGSDATSAMPYAAAAATASSPTTTAGAGTSAANGNQGSGNAGTVSANAALAANTAGQDATTQGGTGTSTGFGADQLNARIALGAPIYASQPNATMATVPAHLLDAPVAHAKAELAAAKPGDDAAPKTDAATEASEPLPASANAANATPPSLEQHASASEVSSGALGTVDNGSAANAAAANTSSGAAAASDAANSAAANAALVQQPNATPPTAPAQLDAAVHTAAPYVPVGEQVALSLKQALASDNNEIRIQLKPASLGTIDVKLNLTQDGRVSAVISADRSDTLNMLKQDSGSLQQGLRDAGLNADGNSLSFNLRGDAQSFAQNSWQQGSSGGGGRAAYADTGGAAQLSTASAVTAQRYHAGALNIEV